MTMPSRLLSWLDIETEEDLKFPIPIVASPVIPRGVIGLVAPNDATRTTLVVPTAEDKALVRRMWNEMPEEERRSINVGMRVARETDTNLKKLGVMLGKAPWN